MEGSVRTVTAAFHRQIINNRVLYVDGRAPLLQRVTNYVLRSHRIREYRVLFPPKASG
jgi:hypothetical protein